MLAFEGMKGCMCLSEEEELDVVLQKAKRKVLDVAQGEVVHFAACTLSRSATSVLLDRSRKLLDSVVILGELSSLNTILELLHRNRQSERVLVLHQIGSVLQILAISAIASKVAS